MAIPKERLILSFHGIGPIPTRIGLAERAYWCDDRSFKSMLDSIVNVPQQVSIELTFDDGNISDAVVALPALVSRGLTACFFVCAGRIGLEGYLDRSAMNELISAGMEIGSHGWNHVNWRRIDDKTLDIEIDDARKKLSDIIARNVDKLAIPFGYYDRRVLRRLRRSNSEIRAVFTSDGGRAPLSGWLLPRESYMTSWTDNTPGYLTTCPLSIRRRIARLVKPLR
jgi:peptidoglycan/xylan/chitin deacetylase (PgdA/CDA1 family)